MEFITTSEFNTAVLSSDKPTFVLFTTPSAIKSYLLEEFLFKLDSTKYKIVKVNIEQNYELTIKYSIRIVPSIWLFQNGNFITQKGLREIFSPKDIEDMINV